MKNRRMLKRNLTKNTYTRIYYKTFKKMCKIQ